MTAPAPQAPYSRIIRDRLTAALGAGDIEKVYELGMAALDAYDEGYELWDFSQRTPHVDTEAAKARFLAAVERNESPVFIDYGCGDPRVGPCVPWAKFSALSGRNSAAMRLHMALEETDEYCSSCADERIPCPTLRSLAILTHTDADDGSAAVAVVLADGVWPDAS